MGIRLGSVVMTIVIAVTLLALAAPSALAATWYISDATGYDVGTVTKVSTAKYTVKKNSGAKVGTVVKTAAGWRVLRGGTKVAVLKSNGPAAHPVNMYQGSTRVGRCGPTRAGDRLAMDRCAGSKVVVCLGFAPTACPARAALGAARLLLWY